MPFGLRNASQTFQRFIDEVVRDLPGVFVYIDDILVASSNEKEHEQHLQALFKRLDEHGLIISPEKSIFGATSIDFLGFNISSLGILPINDRIQAINEMSAPKDVKGVQRFLGAVNYYRRFLANVSEIMAPLYALLRSEPSKGQKKPTKTKFVWSQACQDSFDNLKNKLKEATLLHHLVPGAKLALSVDASDVGIGAVCEQLVNKVWQPLAFFSKSLNPAQSKYSAFDRELLAVKLAIRHFRYFVEGEDFIVFTDHKPLTTAINSQNPTWTPRQHRHFSEISQYTSDLRHVSGKDNVIADTLSRAFAVQQLTVDWAQFQRDQEADPDVPLFGTSITNLDIRKINHQGHSITCDVSLKRPRPVVPEAWQKPIFDHFHQFSHPGAKATNKLISEHFVWHRMKPTITKWVKECQHCQASKVQRHVRHPPQDFDSPTGRFGHLHVDVVGPLPPSNGYRYLFTVIDRWTRWPDAIPIVEATSQSCATALLHGWISRFGTPETITSDRGTTFTSELWAHLTRFLGCKAPHTTAYHPQANGMIERFHRSLKASLMARLEGQSSQWFHHLPFVLLGLRVSMKEDLGYSPAEAVYGEPLRLPGELISTNPDSTSNHWATDLRQHKAPFPSCEPSPSWLSFTFIRTRSTLPSNACLGTPRPGYATSDPSLQRSLSHP